MAEIEITLPTVQYGNVKLTCKPEELDELIKTADSVGMAAALYLNIFTQGFKAGAQMDVSASVSASQEAAPGDPQAAADRLADGRSPRTVDEANEMAKQVIESELGSVTEVPAGDVVAHETPPWDKPAAEVKKPWETEVTAPVVIDATW